MEEQRSEVQQCSAMVAGAPSSNVSTASVALSLQSACPATLYTKHVDSLASMLKIQFNQASDAGYK
jgi:hypothetical protein